MTKKLLSLLLALALLTSAFLTPSLAESLSLPIISDFSENLEDETLPLESLETEPDTDDITEPFEDLETNPSEDETSPSEEPETEVPTETETVEAIVPTSLSVQVDAPFMHNGKVIASKGDSFVLSALDQNGDITPVSWSTSSGHSVTVDETTGEVVFTSDMYSGSTSYLYFTATSILDETVTKTVNVQATGYLISTYYKEQTIALSSDGQSEKTASVSGGVSGLNEWSWSIPEGVAELAQDPANSSSAKFTLRRPGTFTVTFSLNPDQILSDSARITVTGVAVEGDEGAGKQYLSQTSLNPNPTAQLTAYCAESLSVSSWASADESIATVDSDGVVTAHAIGSTIITATDTEGNTGGIKVVVESGETPYFESLEFSTIAFTSGSWITGESFSPTLTEYHLPIKNYSTSSLALQKTTLYDSDKYTAVASYTNFYGEDVTIPVLSGAMTTLPNQPFGESLVTITLSDKENPENKTDYFFTVSRPRDTTKAIKTGGITLSPSDRMLSQTKYNSLSEGTMQRCDSDGNLTGTNGVNSTTHTYRTILFDDASSFRLNIASSTSYAHLRYSFDDGDSWLYLPQGGGMTEEIDISDTQVVLIEIIDDAAFTETESFEGAASYTVIVDSVSLSVPYITFAEATHGDWYPQFNKDHYTYYIMVPNDAEAPLLTFSAADNCSVTMGTTPLSPDESGLYSVPLSTTLSSITVTSADGTAETTYKFAYKKKSALAVPDKVVDYLCIGSQYTNGGYGTYPEHTLSGSLKSLGNAGGYITYYYETPLTDSPLNKYGMDFYVIGNSSEINIDSMAELGQVYVSEDGETWYALAGSEHYEENAIWDYTITYTKGTDNKSYWSDNYSNTIDYSAKAWPSASVYTLNSVADDDTYTFTGVVFESQTGTITGDSTSTYSFAARASFGYADYYATNLSGTTLSDINPYVASPSKANGFDLAWAVDSEGYPVDVSGMEFHYVKVATASNIFAGSFQEKSTEVSYVIRTTPQNEEVGRTPLPESITISDSAQSRTVSLTESGTLSIDIGDMKYIKVSVNGATDESNIYINNLRASSRDGFVVTKASPQLVRIIIQQGDMEPCIIMLNITGTAKESKNLIEGVRINADGAIRNADKKNATTYTATVGSSVTYVSIIPTLSPEASYTINGESLTQYPLAYGKNTFEITATDTDGNSETITLSVTRQNETASSDKTISVSFTLYGDTHHGDELCHTYKNDKSSLSLWLPRKTYTVPYGSTVLDVLEMALTEAGIPWENSSGNYIESINDLAEFDNGTLSGWLYLLNGDYPSLGVAEQKVKNGDRIIFHYTDDYTFESRTSSSKPSQDSTAKIEKEPAEEPTEAPTHPFSDVKSGSWYEEYVIYTYNNNLFTGVSESLFSPETPITRGMLTTLLYRLENCPEVTSSHPFTDVKSDFYYSDAISWAYENGIVKGISDTLFAPDRAITREEMAVIIYRYLASDFPTATPLKPLNYTDLSLAPKWCVDAVSYCNEMGIMTGNEKGEFGFTKTATRAETAKILTEISKLINGADSD